MSGFVTDMRFAAAALVLAMLPACQWNVGEVEVRLVYTADVAQNPLREGLVRALRLSLTGEDLPRRQAQFALDSGTGGSLSAVPLGNGRVVTVEGLDASGAVQSRGISMPFATREGLTRVYLFFSRVGEFSSPPSGAMDPDWVSSYKTRMSSPRMFHAATPLPDGQVLISGGITSPQAADPLGRYDAALIDAERFDPGTGAFLQGALPHMRARGGRAMHTATVLAGAEAVLLVGGEPADPTQTAEYLDLHSGSFEDTGALVQPRSRHAAVAVGGERAGVLIAGGTGSVPGELLDSLELFEAGRFDALSGVSLSRARSGATAVPCPQGVLVIGGWEQWEPDRVASRRVDHVRIDAQGVTQSSFELLQPRAGHAAVLIEDDGGSARYVLVCGGLRDAHTIEGSCELLDAELDSVTPYAGLVIERWLHTASLTRSAGKVAVLVSGGFSSAEGRLSATRSAVLVKNPLGSVERDDVTMVSARAGHTATALPNGTVLLAGGASLVDGISGVVEMPQTDYEIFNPR